MREEFQTKVLPMIQGLFQGNDAFAVPVVTFGNRNYDNALIELRNELENNHFHTIAAGAFVAQHAFTDQLAMMLAQVSQIRKKSEGLLSVS